MPSSYKVIEKLTKMADYTNIECNGAHEKIPNAGDIYSTSSNEYDTNDDNRTKNCIQYVKEFESIVQVLDGLVGTDTKVTAKTKRATENVDKHHSLPDQISRTSFVPIPTQMTACRCPIAIAMLNVVLIAGLAGNVAFLYLKGNDGKEIQFRLH